MGHNEIQESQFFFQHYSRSLGPGGGLSTGEEMSANLPRDEKRNFFFGLLLSDGGGN